ncbi:MAG: hypothetical protein QME51_08655 [Planctomycetota bacterium]|nr:hypothetical protein [Planctomycetota bacterium]
MQKPQRTVKGTSAVKLITKLQTDPITFFRMQWDEPIWHKQEEIIQSVLKNKRTYVRACNSSSKTHTAARIAIWWLSCFVPSIVVSTATTYTQVEAVLWGNIRLAYHKAKYKLPGNILPSSPYWRISDNHYGIGLSVREKERFQGFHTSSGRVFIIVDEGSGVSDEIYEAINGLLTNDNARLLVISNPLRPSGAFYQAFKTGTEGRIHIDGEEAVKFQTDIPGLISQKFLDEQRILYEQGNNPFYLPRCRGEFPDVSIDEILNLRDLETAIFNPVVVENENFQFFSIDWAYGGKNETVIQHWNGAKQSDQLAFSKKEPEDTIGRIIGWIREHKGNDVWHDKCGGGKIYGDLLQNSLGNEYRVQGIDSAGSGDDVYENLRAKIWFNAREMLHTGGIVLLNDPIMQEQLLSVTYYHNRKGKILITSKQDIEKDYGFSPDRGDCAVYGLWGLKQMRLIKGRRFQPKPNWWDETEKPERTEEVLGVADH